MPKTGGIDARDAAIIVFDSGDLLVIAISCAAEPDL